ncbi:hypothetical protein ZIOFF_024541 [Zingiber officinale]|uniref:EVE domain-containing protein n=1 Tax=Zingiber officinale TaxID=94328 RepID=A0A8J5GWI1_ZINOF|nr:hypothetical protein ZIOFF_024541 [Zingiber officinale]
MRLGDRCFLYHSGGGASTCRIIDRHRRGRQAVVPLFSPRLLQRRQRRRRDRGGGRPVAGRDEAPRRTPTDQGGRRRHEGFRAIETATVVRGTRARGDLGTYYDLAKGGAGEDA